MKKTFDDDFNLSVIAESGQCFRFNRIDENTYKVVAYGKVLIIKDMGENTFDFDCSSDDYKKIWHKYFDLDTNYSSIRKSVKDNAFLCSCAEQSVGMRILNQDKWEMVVSFIISQRKSIPAIKTSIERLCELCGDKIDDENYAFPTPVQILYTDLNKMAGCGLGYRLPYIIQAAETFNSEPAILKRLDKLSDEELLEELKKMQGVGDKVASCIALFGFHRLNFFPKDVWINRALDEHFHNGFDFAAYAPYNGVIQQYMFYAYRNANR
jgi:N-glycosylase/DNA lyase